MDEEVLNHYCWMYSTFDIPEDFMVSAADYVCIHSAKASVNYATERKLKCHHMPDTLEMHISKIGSNKLSLQTNPTDNQKSEVLCFNAPE